MKQIVKEQFRKEYKDRRVTTPGWLVSAVRAGDEEAFDEIIVRFRSMAYSSAYKVLGDAHLAEDVVQEAFVEAYLTLNCLRDSEAFPGWFRRIVYKQCDRFLRRQRVTTVPLDASTYSDEFSDIFNPATYVEQHETQQIVEKAVASLSESERAVIWLFYHHELSLKDIAARLDISINAVKKRLFDARKHLRPKLLSEAQSQIKEQQLAYGESFPEWIRLLIAVRTNDHHLVQGLLTKNPYLVSDRPVWKIRSGLQHMDAQMYQQMMSSHNPLLHEAVRAGSVEMVRLLLDYGANINARFNGLTALHEAVLNNSPAIVQLLLLRLAGVDVCTDTRLTPLHHAAMRGYVLVAQGLLLYGANVDSRDCEGRTALHWAALKGYRAIVQLLLQYNANPALRDEQGRTPADWAFRRGYGEVTALLYGDKKGSDL